MDKNRTKRKKAHTLDRNGRARRRAPVFGAAEYLTVLTAGAALLLLVLYMVETIAKPPETAAGLIAGAATTFLFAALCVRFVPCWARAWSGTPEESTAPLPGLRTSRPEGLRPIVRTIIWLTLWRAFFFVLLYALYTRINGFSGTFFRRLDLWDPVSFDARHYLSIAENWYAGYGSERFLLVFLPLYPIVVRAAQGLTGSYLTAGLLVSNLCAILSGYALYELALLDTDRYTARRAVKYLNALPAAFLFSAPLSDSLFLLLTILCMYCVRKKHPLAGCLFGGLAAFTRLLGLTLLAPVAFELIADAVRSFRAAREEKRAAPALDAVRRLACLLLIPLGFGAYLLVNRHVSGDWFRFLVYQRENWQQMPGWFFATSARQWDTLLDALRRNDLPYALGLWVPNIVFMTCSLFVMIPAVRRVRPSYAAYFIGYFAVSMGATWLLSAPRYLTALFPLPLAMAELGKSRLADAAMTLLCLAGLVLYMYAFAAGWYVY